MKERQIELVFEFNGEEITAIVTYRADLGYAAVLYADNGDPGYPGEHPYAEFFKVETIDPKEDITKAVLTDKDLSAMLNKQCLDDAMDWWYCGSDNDE